MFSEPDLLQIILLFHMRLEYEMSTTFRRYHLFRIESTSMDFWRAQVLQLLKGCYHNVSFPNSSRVQCVPEEYSGLSFLPRIGEDVTGLWQSLGDSQPSIQKELPVLQIVDQTAVHKVFSFGQEVLDISQIAIAFIP